MNKKILKMMESSHILILANDEDIDEDIGFILKQLGYRYLVAGDNYARAIKLLSVNQIKCVLLPLLNEGVTSLVSAINQAYQVPIIFYTTHFNSEVLQRIKEIPPPVYLTRIYNKDELYVNIELACYNHDFVI